MKGFTATLPVALSLAFLLVAALPGASQTVEVLCAVSSESGTAELSEGVISACLASFFDNGIIATNGRPVALEKEAWRDPGLGIGQAREGLVDYIVSIYIVYVVSDLAGGKPLPASLSFRVLRVKDAALLDEGSIEVPPASAVTAKKPETLVRALGASLAKACLPIIAGASGLRVFGEGPSLAEQAFLPARTSPRMGERS
jgi:hypothetical protein